MGAPPAIRKRVEDSLEAGALEDAHLDFALERQGSRY
jgi:hypothetical protein